MLLTFFVRTSQGGDVGVRLIVTFPTDSRTSTASGDISLVVTKIASRFLDGRLFLPNRSAAKLVFKRPCRGDF
jgi:hypothetical protein